MTGDAIRTFILFVVALGACGYVYYVYEDGRPCVHLVEYSIGSVDPRFGTTKDELERSLNRAASIWETVAGRALYTMVPEGGVIVDLVYDEREASAKLGQRISEKQEAIDATRVSIERAHAALDDRQLALRNDIDAINARGGATPAERSRIQDEQRRVRSDVEAFNSKVASLNAQIKTMNAEIAEFNKTAGRTFRAGEYVQNASGRRINIYAYIGEEQLERVLAHELGHALGLDHNEDPNAIMYAENESGKLQPSETDVSALRELCGIN